jgi:hypothetical protein
MNPLPTHSSGRFGLFLAPDSRPEPMMSLTAVLAQRGPVQVVDGGNRFAPYQVARLLRAHTTDIAPLWDRITIARAFTCYQMVHLLTQLTHTDQPLLVLHLLATFEDESVDDVEAVRLLRLALAQLHRLRRPGGVVSGRNE